MNFSCFCFSVLINWHLLCQGWDWQRKIDPNLTLKSLSDSLVISRDDMETESFTSNFFHRFCHFLLMNYFVIISLGWEYPLKMRKATQPNILAWRIPWTVYGVAKSPARLSNFHFHFVIIWLSFEVFPKEFYLWNPQGQCYNL